MRICDQFANYYESVHTRGTTPQELLDDHVLFDLSEIVKLNDSPSVNHDIEAYPPYESILYFFAMGEGAVVIASYTENSPNSRKPVKTRIVVFYRKTASSSSWIEVGQVEYLYTPTGMVDREKPLDLQISSKVDLPDDAVDRLLMVSTNTAVWVAQLLNCKNIALDEHDPMDDMKRAVRQHWIRKGREPLKKHYTLSVRAPGRVSSPTNSAGSPSKGIMPLHTCRGHFAKYDEDHRLFGKYSGTFWIPAHVRGAKKNGEIIKDYKLKPGEEP